MRNGVEKMRQGREKRQNQITRRKLLILAGLLLLAVLVGVTIFFLGKRKRLRGESDQGRPEIPEVSGIERCKSH